jgi:hypothetical protein
MVFAGLALFFDLLLLLGQALCYTLVLLGFLSCVVCRLQLLGDSCESVVD